jgi:hypothetical protein
MKHLGYSVTGDHYSYYNYTDRSRISSKNRFSQDSLIQDFGIFSLDDSFYDTLRTFGYYVSGEYSILNKWIEFTVRADTDKMIQPQLVYQILTTSPEEERDVYDSQAFFKNLLSRRGGLECVWSGRTIRTPEAMAIDHMVPFSVWKNNDLWNLLPTHAKVNLQKRDLIPSERLLQDRRDKILGYWEALIDGFRYRFTKEVEVSLMDGHGSGWSLDRVFNSLAEKCQYMIEVRGLPSWSQR